MPPKLGGSQYRSNVGAPKGGKDGKGKQTRERTPESTRNAGPRGESSRQTNQSTTSINLAANRNTNRSFSNELAPKTKSFAKAGQASNPLRPSSAARPARSNSLDSSSSTDLEDLRKQVAELEAQVDAQSKGVTTERQAPPPFYTQADSLFSGVAQQTAAIELADRSGLESNIITRGRASEGASSSSTGNARRKISLLSDASEESNLSDELLEEPIRVTRTRGFTWVDSHRDYFSFREQLAITLTQILGAASYLLALEWTKVTKSANPAGDDAGVNGTDVVNGTDGGETIVWKEAEYSLHSTVLISTFMQNIIVGGVAVFNEGKEIFVVHWPTFYYSLVAGAFWAVYENLTTTSVLLVGASTVALVQQTRVVFTALLRSMMLGSHVTELHWHGLFLLLVSILGFHFWRLAAWRESLGKHHDWTDEIGIFLCVLAAVFYAFATVFSERLYRDPRNSVVSFEIKFLYIASRKFGFCLVYSIVMQIHTRQAFFEGWTFGVFMICVVQIAAVVGTHFTLRRLDAVMCAISEVVSVAIVWTVQNLVSGTTFQPVALCFVLLVLQSVFIFGRVAHKANMEEDSGKSKFAGRWLHAMDAMEARATKLKSTVTPATVQVLTRTTDMFKSVIRQSERE